jgi:LysR family pca operon transcriptional activator
MNIDPRHLANLQSIATHGSFNRAAAARGISQPALSNSIAQLERRLGVQVLDRSRLGSELNEVGRILVRGAGIIEAVLLHAIDEVRLRKSGVVGPLRVGVAPSITLKFMPAVMSALLERSPAVAITIVEGLDDQLLVALRAGELDLVVGPLAGVFPAPPDVVEELLFEDPFSIGVGPQHSLRARSSLKLAELQAFPWVLPLPGNSYRRHIEALFTAEGVPWPSNCVHTSSLSLVESILADTDRITMITKLQAAMQNTNRIKSIRLINGGSRSIGIKRRITGSMSALATGFVAIAHEVARAIAPAVASRARPRRPRAPSAS